MTTTNTPGIRNRDNQDATELGIWGKIEYISGKGSVLKVRGTDTVDEEATVINIGGGMNLPENSDAEVIMFAMGSDTNHKYVLLQIPHKVQRQWAEGTGGTQNPLDGDKAVEFNTKRIHNTDPNFAVGEGLFEVVGGNVIVRGNLVVQGTIQATGDIGTASDLRGVKVRALEVGASPVSPVIPGFST